MLFIFDDCFLFVGIPVSVLSQYLSKCILIFNSADLFVVLTIHSWIIDYVYTCIFCRNYYLRKIQVLIISGTVSFYCSCVTSFLLFANISITTLQLTFFIVRCFSLGIDLIRLYYSLFTRVFIRHMLSTISVINEFLSVFDSPFLQLAFGLLFLLRSFSKKAFINLSTSNCIFGFAL